jgi:very-short-patch-repair endonuclease
VGRRRLAPILSHPRETVAAMEAVELLFAYCARQYGFVAWHQAAAAAIDRRTWKRLTCEPVFEAATPRVARLVGAPRHPRAPLMLGTLDGGPGTFAGRRSAAALWELPGFGSTPVELTRAKHVRGRAQHTGRVFSVRHLPDHLVTTVHGVPTVTLPYALFQLAGIEHPQRTQRLVEMVIAKSPGTLRALHALLPELAERGRNGITTMRSILEANPVGARLPGSGLERRLEAILKGAGLPPLRRQVDLGGHEWIGRVDFVDDEVGAVFEVDSLLHHSGATRSSEDAARDVELLEAGFRAVERIAEEWIWYDPDRAVALVRATRRRLLDERRPSGS